MVSIAREALRDMLRRAGSCDALARCMSHSTKGIDAPLSESLACRTNHQLESRLPMSVILSIVAAIVLALLIVYVFKGGAKKGPGSWDGTHRHS